MAEWARQQPAIGALVLIGSRVRDADDPVWRADGQSDWDFQIITSDPDRFARADWVAEMSPGQSVRAYALRRARIGGVPKVNLVLDGEEADFVLLPAGTMRLARWVMALGLHRREGKLRRSLQDLVLIIRPGWRFLHGGERWDPTYRRLVQEVPDPRLDDAAVRQKVAEFRCDAVWVQRKLERGELLAAQRQLHLLLAETNLQLLHELRLRRGERSFPEARRIERVLGEADLGAVTISALPNGDSLRQALDHASKTCDWLERELMGKEERARS